MGCMSSKRDVEDNYPNVFQVMNVDEHGNSYNSGKLELTDIELVLYQKGRSPVKWPLKTLRRYGFDSEHFSFESGRRCQTGPGIYAFKCRRAEQLFNLLQSRILTRNGESEASDVANNLGNSLSTRESMYLELGPLRRSNPGSRFSSENGTTRLSSVGSTSGSVGPLSPQSIISGPLPLDTVPLIPPLPANRPVSQNLYANEEVIAIATLDLEETNNNKTCDEHLSPTFEHLYLNSDILELLPKEENNPKTESDNPEQVSSPSVDNNHLYMNIIPGTDTVAPLFPTVQAQPSPNFVTLNWDKQEDSLPNYGNLEGDYSNWGQKVQTAPVAANDTTTTVKSINYIVLDLPSGDPPKSPTTLLAPDAPRKLSGGYAAIDFKKTVALSHSVNPDFDTDSESSRKTRHSSNIYNMLFQERHSSSVSD